MYGCPIATLNTLKHKIIIKGIGGSNSYASINIQSEDKSVCLKLTESNYMDLIKTLQENILKTKSHNSMTKIEIKSEDCPTLLELTINDCKMLLIKLSKIVEDNKQVLQGVMF